MESKQVRESSMSFTGSVDLQNLQWFISRHVVLEQRKAVHNIMIPAYKVGYYDSSLQSRLVHMQVVISLPQNIVTVTNLSSPQNPWKIAPP